MYVFRSSRDFDEGKLLRSAELAHVLFACQGVTAPAPPRDALGHEANARRTCPSGGAVYPLTVYVAAKRGKLADDNGCITMMMMIAYDDAVTRL
jgi:hypothetical protein